MLAWAQSSLARVLTDTSPALQRTHGLMSSFVKQWMHGTECCRQSQCRVGRQSVENMTMAELAVQWSLVSGAVNLVCIVAAASCTDFIPNGV